MIGFMPHAFVYFTNSMEQSSTWEANSHLASQEIPCLLWNPKIIFRVHKFPPPDPILSHMTAVHTLPISLRFILILPLIYL
jgi:hypothetical protein